MTPTSTYKPLPVLGVAFERGLWLGRAVAWLRPTFEIVGLTVPKVSVQTGQTITCSNGLPALGQCSPSDSSPFRLPVIVVNETLIEPVEILSVLMHEMLHAVDNCVSGHGPWFQGWANALDLVFCPHPATIPGSTLRRGLQSIAAGLGRYPEPKVGFHVTAMGQVHV